MRMSRPWFKKERRKNISVQQTTTKKRKKDWFLEKKKYIQTQRQFQKIWLSWNEKIAFIKDDRANVDTLWLQDININQVHSELRIPCKLPRQNRPAPTCNLDERWLEWPANRSENFHRRSTGARRRSRCSHPLRLNDDESEFLNSDWNIYSPTIPLSVFPELFSVGLEFAYF